MDMNQINQNIDEFAKQELERSKKYYDELPEEEEDEEEQELMPSVGPIDMYQNSRVDSAKEFKKTHPRGASTLTKKIAEEELEKLAKIKKRAEMDSKYWETRGDKSRAKMVKDQYIEEHFLPALEVVVISSTPDEVLNSKDILNEFDKLSMQYGPGYTAAYLRTAYGDQLGNASSRSDGYVRDMVCRIKAMCASDQIRAAYGVAQKLKNQIDNGEHTADEDDYEIITRVASIG